MASTAKIARNQRRQKIVEQYAERRAALKQTIASPHTPPQAREAAQAALRRQPRDASATRLRNRDAIDGRPRGFLRKAGLSRVRFRQLALRGELPGVHKASW